MLRWNVPLRGTGLFLQTEQEPQQPPAINQVAQKPVKEAETAVTMLAYVSK